MERQCCSAPVQGCPEVLCILNCCLPPIFSVMCIFFFRLNLGKNYFFSILIGRALPQAVSYFTLVFKLFSYLSHKLLPFQLPAVVQRVREKKWKVGELLHAVLQYCDMLHSAHAREDDAHADRGLNHTPLFQWILDHV